MASGEYFDELLFEAFLTRHEVIGCNALIEEKFIKILAVKAVAQGHLIKTVFTLNAGSARKTEQYFIEVVDAGIYLYKLRPVANVAYRAIVHEGAFFEHGKMRAHLLHLVQQVAGKDYGLTVSRDLFDELTDLGDTHGVETVGGLIEYEYGGIVQQSGGNGQPLLHTQGVRSVFVVFAFIQLHEFEYAGYILWRALLDHSVELEIFLPGEIRVKNGMLEYGADLFAGLMRGCFAKPGILTGGGIDHTHEHTQGGGFAAAVGAEHAEHLPAFHFKVKVIDSAEAAEILGETFDR